MISGEETATSIGASLGMTGALLIIFIFFYFRKLKLFYRKLVFILSIYDLFQSISYLLPGNSNGVICKIQYFLIAIFSTTSQFWSATISFFSYLKVYKQLDDKKLNKIHKWFHLIMIIPIIVLIIIVSITRDYDKSKTYWCTSVTNTFIITVYSFLWVFIIICLIFYILTIIQIRKVVKIYSTNSISTTKINQMNQIWIQLRMSFIPLIQIIILIPGTIRRIRNIAKPSASDIESLDIIQSLLLTSQGFWDFWIFVVFDPEIRKKIKNCFCSKSRNLEEENFGDEMDYPSKKEKRLLVIEEVFQDENEMKNTPLITNEFDSGIESENML
ncbi:g-protein coupled receptor 1 [Anaeramoeba ignava]|uniref:G-protein coupled receptor 1 n=1 Tax=Anaeramoeba ignava TaxID=1746090 RepID=A0A9Q0LWY6_ANAIG|nr:g-protein coupled receptor 1 [Anaeramoeba ignava]